MNKAASFDIVIAGGGLVGTALACRLGSDPATAPLSVALVDPGLAKQPKTPVPITGVTDFDPRVVALTRASQHLLERLDVWGSISAQRLCPYHKMTVWDGEGNAAIHFDCRELHQPDLGHIVENSLVQTALRARADSLDSVTFIAASVTGVDTDAGTRITLNDGQVLQTPLLVAADGGNSAVRQLCGFATREWDYGQRAIVATVETSESHSATAWQRFMQSGPLAFLPLLDEAGNSHYSSIVWSLDEDLADDIMALNDRDFAERLTRAFEARLGPVLASSKRYCFPLRQRHAVDYFVPGVVLVGDAAHTIHPLAGQGVNLGLRDIEMLIREIVRAAERGIPLEDASILRRYQRERKPANLAMMALMESFKRLFGSRQPALHLLRNLGMGGLERVPVLKNQVARQALDIG